MWVIRFLNGPLIGQMVNLKQGQNLIGRQPSCDIPIAHPGISKHHCVIAVSPNEITINDLDSSNGTFVNGLKVKSYRLSANDNISMYDIMAEIINVADVNKRFHPANMNISQFFGNAAINQNPHPEAQFQGQAHGQAQPEMNPESIKQNIYIPKGLEGFVKLAQTYIEEVILPGIYKLAEWTEFRWVLLMFMAIFIIFVTSLSAIPLMRILKASIEKESQRRALTIARTLAKINQIPLMEGQDANVSVDLANREPGVSKSYIFSNVDNMIISPPSMSGRYPNEKFVHTARKEGQEVVEQIDSSTIGALVPIEYYNPQTGSQSIAAYAVVVYDMGTLAVDDGRTISLFIQTFFIAVIVGSILFFFLYKLIQYPIVSINKQLDRALRDGTQQLQLNYQFPVIQELIANIGSALSRIGSGSVSDIPEQDFETDRNQEMANLVQLIGFPAMAVQAIDQSIAAINSAFEEKTGLPSSEYLYGNVNNINDQSLKLSIEDLIERVNKIPDQMATNELEFNGVKHEIIAQGVQGSKKLSYILFVILPASEDSA
ncbi:MAG: FHA domain-containing protein [Bdellovibrionaceae bacterium]|nr:FHA domain-containing protein [Pseudobdellovibrionaceae bacterium]